MRHPLALLGAIVLVALVLLALQPLLRPRREAPARPPPGTPLPGTEVPLPAALEPHRARLERMLAPAAAARPGGTPVMRLGGAPRLPEDATWPAAPSRPMSFLGELDLAALRAAAPGAAPALPGEGRLLLFYDVEEMPWGFDPGDRAHFRLLHVRGPGVERAAPQGATTFTSRTLGVKAVGTLPSLEGLVEGFDLGGAEEAYAEHVEALLPDPDHRVGGHAAWIQSDAREEAAITAIGGSTGNPEQHRAGRARLAPGAAEAWKLLWQLDSDDAAGFMWGDVGRLYVLARDEDLRAGRFDRVWLVLQCY